MCGFTWRVLLSTRDTVAIDTPARAAICVTDTRACEDVVSICSTGCYRSSTLNTNITSSTASRCRSAGSELARAAPAMVTGAARREREQRLLPATPAAEQAG